MEPSMDGLEFRIRNLSLSATMSTHPSSIDSKLPFPDITVAEAMRQQTAMHFINYQQFMRSNQPAILPRSFCTWQVLPNSHEGGEDAWTLLEDHLTLTPEEESMAKTFRFLSSEPGLQISAPLSTTFPIKQAKPDVLLLLPPEIRGNIYSHLLTPKPYNQAQACSQYSVHQRKCKTTMNKLSSSRIEQLSS